MKNTALGGSSEPNKKKGNKMKEIKRFSEFTLFELLDIERRLTYHIPELTEEICYRAGLLEEFKNATGETFEIVLDDAIEILSNRYAWYDMK